MTRLLLDVASYQGDLATADVVRAGFTGVNLKISHGLTRKSVHPDVAGWARRAETAGLGIATFHFLDGSAGGVDQAGYAHDQLRRLDLLDGTAHQVDCESTATETILRDYITTMQTLLGRPVVVYTGDWWWTPRGWDVSALTPYVWAAPNVGYLPGYPGDGSPHWTAGYGGWRDLSVMQYTVGPLVYPDGTTGTIKVSQSAVRNPTVWSTLTGGDLMAMDPRTHPRGTRPDFSMAGLPANPNPQRITAALWWLVQMRLRLEPQSDNGGVFAAKPGYHSYGSRLPDHGLGNTATDHSIRRAPDRTGPWWQGYASAHDWTFTRAHSGTYTEISKYSSRLRNAMRDPGDLRPDDVYAYFIGQIDSDPVVEGYNEYTDGEETGDETHLWHRHDSFRRNIVGDFWAMWKALSIDMGWTYTEWQRSVAGETDMPLEPADKTWLKSAEFTAAVAAAVWGHKLHNPYSNTAVDAGTILRYVPSRSPHDVTQAAIAALRADVAAVRAENAALEAGTKTLIQQLVDLIAAAGGSVEVGSVLTKLDEVQAGLIVAASAAGEKARREVLAVLARSAQNAAGAYTAENGTGG